MLNNLRVPDHRNRTVDKRQNKPGEFFMAVKEKWQVIYDNFPEATDASKNQYLSCTDNRFIAKKG